MVGVPHSTGCARCRERRIKCDEATPNCTQCRRYGRPCPGYKRIFRFQDEGPALERRHQSSSSSSSTRRSLPADAAAVIRDQALAMIQSPSPTSSPTPTVYTQHPHLFADFARDTFPTLYAQHRRFRAARHTPDCAAYIAATLGRCAFRDGAVYCVATIARAQRTHDRALMKSARQVYASTLQQVAGALHGGALATDADMLAAIMMLSVYEMYAATRGDAWAVHADGVKRLMVSRGAGAHATGFARSCYVAFRGLLVAAALHEGGACFLEEGEWQELARRVRGEDARRAGGEDGEWVRVADAAFMEVVRCPRYVAEARTVQQVGALRELVQSVRASRQRLGRLGGEARALMGRGRGDAGLALALQGVECAVGLLDGLLERLREDEVLPFRVVSALDRCLAAPVGARDPTALDRVASSMGMLGTALVPERYR